MRLTRRDLRQTTWGAGARGVIRRFRVAASRGVAWLLEGHEDGDGNLETDLVEVAPNVGFYSRPKASHRVEAFVVKVGGDNGHPIVVATRDQDGVKLLGDLDEDETCLFTSTLMVKITKDGEVQIGTIGGTFEPLVKRSEFNAHTHPIPVLAVVNATPAAPGSVTTAAGTTTVAAPVTGTTKLKAE